MSEMTLKPNEKLDVRNILKVSGQVRAQAPGMGPGAQPAPNLEMGPFTYHDVSEPLKQSVGLPPAKYFGDIDPQPLPVITTEIASGRFEDDIRRMRMAAWHGADHIMVIPAYGPVPYRRPDGGHPPGNRRRSHHPQAGPAHSVRRWISSRRRWAAPSTITPMSPV